MLQSLNQVGHTGRWEAEGEGGPGGGREGRGAQREEREGEGGAEGDLAWDYSGVAVTGEVWVCPYGPGLRLPRCSGHG